MSIDGSVRRKLVQPVTGESQKNVGDGGFTDPAQSQGGERYSKLDGGQEFVDRVLELKDRDGTGATMGDQLLDAGFADADQRKLRRDKETAGQDEEGHQDDAKENPLKHLMTSVTGDTS